MPSSRTDFFVDRSGQCSSWRRQLSTKQWSGNKCGAVPTKIQTSSYAMDHRDWPDKQWLAEHQACCCTRLQRFSQTVKPFWRLILSIFCFLNESFLFQNSTLLCQQNRIFVDMSYFLKIAVLSPILSTKCLSTTALAQTHLFANTLSFSSRQTVTIKPKLSLSDLKILQILWRIYKGLIVSQVGISYAKKAYRNNWKKACILPAENQKGVKAQR